MPRASSSWRRSAQSGGHSAPRRADSQSGFRIYPLALLARARVGYGESASFVFESEILIEAARAGIQASCVPVSVVYAATHRPSHFRPIIDIARITRMVAWRLLARGLFLQGLIRSLGLRPR
jgi:hypothetical protein